MAAIDVSDIVSDPDFQSRFSVVSSSRVVSAGGVGQDTPSKPADHYGVVVPNKSTLTRQADGSRLTSSIDIYTRCPLTEGYKIDDVNSVLADVVTWNNRRYTVSKVEDWSDYGEGYIRAAADLLDQSPPQSIGENQ